MTTATAATVINVVACAVLAIIAVVGTVVATRPDALRAGVARRSEVTGIPLGSADIVDALAARLRRLYVATGATLAAGLAVLAAVAPILADSTPPYLLAAAPFVFIAVAVTRTVVTVTHPLFAPPADAPRVARASTRRVGDYLGPLRRALPWCITAAAAVWVGILAVRGEAPLVSIVTVVVAAAGLVALPWLDRAVLDAPQAASHSLELAWDDAFRADAFGAARATLCLVALTGGLLVPLNLSSWTPLVLNGALTAVVLIYARSPLRAALLPPWLAATTTAGRR